MNHLSRLLAILTILKSKRLVTGNELARKFDVSLRTIYRDIKKLEESGVPVMTIEGRGYSIMDGYIVAPIMFDEMEVSALITAEQLIGKTNDDSLIQHFERTLQKIKSVFKSSLQTKGELLERNMYVFKNKADPTRTSSLSDVQMAIINFNVIEMTYQAKDQKPTLRKIEPLAIYSINEKWILVAWCHLRTDHRAFRLDRIKDFRILDEVFEDRKFDLGDYFIRCAEIENNP